MRRLAFGLLGVLLIVSGCGRNQDWIEIEMTPGDNSQYGLRWSPKGEKIALEVGEDGLVGQLALGPDTTKPVHLLLAKSPGAEHFDLLYIDRNRNGVHGETADTVLKTSTQETRGKIWSSFTTEIPIEYHESKSQTIVYQYPLSLWFVEDPTNPEEELIIRYSRRGWMEGKAETEWGTIAVLITEMEMDGVYDRRDSWALDYDTAYNVLFESGSAHDLTLHNWLGEQAFGVDSIYPSGRMIRIKPVDPQISRAEEERQNDWLAPDREAKHSGDTVKFLHDFAYAQELAKMRGAYLFIDFETTWCGPCKTMDQFVYTADRVVEAAKNVICVKVDGDKQRDLVDRFKVSGYPTLVLLNPEMQVIKKATGYQSVDNTVAFLKVE